MFAKIFAQIFDSTIAENYKYRHIFMDLLVMADVDGCVNKTAESIARHTNVPIEEIKAAIEFLSSPDPESQNKEHDGRRLIPIEEGRSWGWRIVSYAHYRNLRSEEERRQYHRDYYEKKTKPKRQKRGYELRGKSPLKKEHELKSYENRGIDPLDLDEATTI